MSTRRCNSASPRVRLLWVYSRLRKQGLSYGSSTYCAADDRRGEGAPARGRGSVQPDAHWLRAHPWGSVAVGLLRGFILGSGRKRADWLAPVIVSELAYNLEHAIKQKSER